MAIENSVKTKICRNCSSPFTDRFCNHCGQEEFKRINYKHLWQAIKSDIFDVENGLLLTFKELWTKPGILVHNYINGIRIKYYSPLKYLIFWTALYLLIIPFTTAGETDHPLPDLVFNTHEVFSINGLRDFGLLWYKLMTKLTNIYFITVIPFLAGANLFIHRKKKFNFTEILVSQTFFCGQFASVAIVATLLSKYFNPPVFGIRFTDIFIQIPYFYLFIKMQKQLFTLRWMEAIRASIVTVFLGTFTYLLLAFLIYAIVKLILT
jgi:hypothetical protein